MMISTKGRYALHVMIDLAQHENGDFIPLKEIAERQHVSKEYMNNILKILVEHDMLLSLRGKGGGYKLCKTPEEYSIGSILRLVEGDLAPVPCVADTGSCPRAAGCPSLPMWIKLDKLITGYLDSISLADLMEPESGTEN